MLRKGLMEELLMGFVFILIISDSYVPMLAFAKGTKNIYIAMMIIHFLFKTNEFYPLTRLYQLFFPFFIYSLFTIFLSYDEPFFIVGTQKTISYFFGFLIIPNYIAKLCLEKGIEFLKRFLLFCFLALVIGFILKYAAPAIAHISTGRYRGVMGNPNGVGLLAVLVFIVFTIIKEYFPVLFSKNEKRLMYGAIFLSVLLSGSRSSIAAILIFFINKKIYERDAFLGFISFTLFLFAIYFANLYKVEIITSLGLQEFMRVDTLEEASGRYIAWDFAWKEIQQNFFIGKGWEYNEYFMQQHFSQLSDLGHQGGVHNSFLSFWMDQGFIGLLLYLRSFFLIFMKGAKKTKFAFPIMFTFIFTAIFESWLVASLSVFAFLGIMIFTIITSDEILENSKSAIKN